MISNNSGTQPKRLLVVDTDTGVDDAVALLMLASRSDIEIVAVHSTHGNCRADQAANNAKYVLEMIGRPDIPVHLGLLEPLEQELHVSGDIHGADGLGNLGHQPIAPVAGPPTAVENLLRLSHKYNGELHLLALGPTTNIAAALRLDPTLLERFRSVTVVGCMGIAPFNSPEPWRARHGAGWRDPNVAHDVAAAKELAEAAGNVTWCGSTVTRHIAIPEAELIQIAQETGNAHAVFAAEIHRFYADFYTTVFAKHLAVLAETTNGQACKSSGHALDSSRVVGVPDEVATAVFLEPDVVLGSTRRPVRLSIDDTGRGCLTGVQTAPRTSGPQHRIILDVDFVKVRDMIFSTLRLPLPW